jgi:hypothetical protein
MKGLHAAIEREIKTQERSAPQIRLASSRGEHLQQGSSHFVGPNILRKAAWIAG